VEAITVSTIVYAAWRNGSIDQHHAGEWFSGESVPACTAPSFLILAVFIAGLMVGRTPEYLARKIESYDVRWPCWRFSF